MADVVTEANEGKSPAGHPVAIWFFFWGEFAERASYYGMRVILPLYLREQLHFREGTAATIYFWFKMAVYFLPLLGGYLADRFFGKYWTIVGFSVPYVLGHFVLGIENQTALVIALMLLAGGSGVIKPNISTLMGLTYDQKRPGQEQLRSAAFLWFYFAINIGALISQLAIPVLRDQYGYAVAFQFPAWLMVISLGVFASGKRHYAVETIERKELSAEEKKERRRILGELFGIFGLMIFVWIAYEHHDVLWVYFIKDHVTLPTIHFYFPWNGWSDIRIAPDQLQTINPLCVVIFAPLFGWLFKKVDPEARVITAPNKLLVGFWMQAASSAIMAGAAFLVGSSAVKVGWEWPVSAYVLLTLGEILVYGTGLELAYAAAPKSMKGFVTGVFLLTQAVANFINSGLVQFYNHGVSPGMFYLLSAVMVLVASVGLAFLTQRQHTARLERV